MRLDQFFGNMTKRQISVDSDFQLKMKYFSFSKRKTPKHNVCYNIQSLWHFKNPTRGILVVHRNVLLSKTLTRLYY